MLRQAEHAWGNNESKNKTIIPLSDKAVSRFNELLGNDAKVFIVTDDSIRHTRNKHSSGENERGQENMTYFDIASIPYVINNFDSMERSEEHDDKLGNKSIEIKKRINGVSVVAIIEKGKNKEFLVSSWIIKKSDALDANSPERNVRNDSDLAKVKKEIEKNKKSLENSSKIVDENGEPMAIFNSTTREGSVLVFTEIKKEGKNFVAAIQLNRSNGGKLEIHSVRSVYQRENIKIIKAIKRKDAIYYNKEKMIEWLSDQHSRGITGNDANRIATASQYNHIAKIIQNHENNTIKGENNNTDVNFQKISQPQTIVDVIKKAIADNMVLMEQKGVSKEDKLAQMTAVVKAEVEDSAVYKALNKVQQAEISSKTDLRGLADLGQSITADMQKQAKELERKAKNAERREKTAKQSLADVLCLHSKNTKITMPAINKKLNLQQLNNRYLAINLNSQMIK